jgi:molybdopterin-containing oxidoreductase family iron-sulfur binding subunit
MLAQTSWQAAVQAAWAGAGKPWNDALRDGGAWAADAATAAPRGSASLTGSLGALDFTPPALASGGEFPVVVYASPNLYDGRGANKPWLQELPDPVTKVVWDHWVELHPETMKRLGLTRGNKITLKTAAGTITTAAYDYIGIRKDVVAMSTGQGHEAYGRYAKGRGANAMAALPATYDERSGAQAYVATTGAIAKAAGAYKLAYLGGDPYTGGQSRQMDRPIALAIPLTELRGSAAAGHDAPAGHGGTNGGHGAPAGHGAAAGVPVTTAAHHDPAAHEPGYPLSPLPLPDPIAGAAKERPNSAYALAAKHRWAMAIDLNSCTGCQACVVACSAENNVAFVGKEQVDRGREMMWIRLERYYEEHDGRLEVRHIPMLCQQCGAAPCESVCPVYATYHNPEGLNAMIYNRCVGTRYCSNNCPYKVRSFNWFEYEFPEPLNWQLNPDVTVREKGVMEKCTFCVQRIRDGKDRAKDQGRKVRDGEIVTACQQGCPSHAILFGDLMDPESEIARVVKGPRGYKALYDLNTHPAITYLKKVNRDLPA